MKCGEKCATFFSSSSDDSAEKRLSAFSEKGREEASRLFSVRYNEPTLHFRQGVSRLFCPGA